MKRIFTILFSAVMVVAGCSGHIDTSKPDGEGTENNGGDNGGNEGDKPVPEVESKFVRKVLLMDFTGQWCSNCPDGAYYLDFIHSRFPDNTYIMALHDNSTGKDIFAIEGQADIRIALGGTVLPSCSIDFRDNSPLTNDTGGKLRASIERSLNEYPAHCGVAVSSSYDAASGKASVTVRMISEATADYRVSLWVVEDGIIGYQKVGSLDDDDYYHSHVIRQYVTGNWRGDKLGTVEAGEEKTASYEIEVSEDWNLDNTYVYAIILDDNKDESKVWANNMEICPIVDGDSGYAYKENTNQQ